MGVEDECSLVMKSGFFQNLLKLHFKLVSYYTFLSSRKHIITSFDLFKEHILKSMDKELTIEDITLLKAITPNNIIFEYVDKNQLVLEEKHFTWKDGFKQKEVDIYDIDKNDISSISNQILILEFVDAGSKTYHNNDFKKGMTPNEMKKLIIKRDNRFRKNLEIFIKLHKIESRIDLNQISKKYIPEHIKFINPIAEINQVDLNSKHRPTNEILENFKKSSIFKNQISQNSIFNIPPKIARYDLDFYNSVDLHSDLKYLLETKGLDKLYSHQSLGIKAILNDNKHVISTTSTSSGKSLIYQIPILQSLTTKSNSTSLLLFPTKALSQDQYRALISYIEELPTIDKTLVQTFDGDTPKKERRFICENANIILTNPDMIHLTLLPRHLQWSRFLQNLKYVVIDELHIYKGTFGANVAYILRRLRRVCEMFGNYDVQFISSSATLNDARLHLSKMIGCRIDKDDDEKKYDDDKVLWIDESKNGAPCGERKIVGWNPDLSHGGSMISDTARLIIQILKMNIRTIVFCTVRKTVELVMKEVRRLLKDDLELLSHIMSYRGGYSVADRRKIEQQMFNGGLTCIVATNALEVGIDIGGLDIVLMCGFPFSISGFEQEMGRAGRRGLESLCLLVAGNDPVSQHYVNKIEELIKRDDWEDLCVDLKNLMIVEGQLQCAFKEIEISNDELANEWSKWWNYLEWETFENLIRERMEWNGKKWTCDSKYLPFPAIYISIRSIDEDSYAVVDITGGNGRQEVIETIEETRTTFTLYEGGIFIHQGLPYLVKEFNVDEKYAIVERVNVDWTTSQRDFTDVDPVLIERIRGVKISIEDKKSEIDFERKLLVYFGNIVKTSIVFGFFKIDKSGKILDSIEVNNPPVKYKSKGVWIDFPIELIEILKSVKLSLAGSIHAVEHSIMNTLPKFVTLGGYDEIGCECKAPEKEFAKRESKRKRPARIILFDNKGGRSGNGISSRIFECIELILKESLSNVEECECNFGCPLCCAGMQCTENSLVLSKNGCIVVLRYMLGMKDPLLNADGSKIEPDLGFEDDQVLPETVIPVTGHVKMSVRAEVT